MSNEDSEVFFEIDAIDESFSPDNSNDIDNSQLSEVNASETQSCNSIASYAFKQPATIDHNLIASLVVKELKNLNLAPKETSLSQQNPRGPKEAVPTYTGGEGTINSPRDQHWIHRSGSLGNYHLTNTSGVNSNRNCVEKCSDVRQKQWSSYCNSSDVNRYQMFSRGDNSQVNGSYPPVSQINSGFSPVRNCSNEYQCQFRNDATADKCITGNSGLRNSGKDNNYSHHYGNFSHTQSPFRQGYQNGDMSVPNFQHEPRQFPRNTDTHIKVPLFNPRETSWLDFKNYFCTIADLANWNDQQKVLKLMACLQGSLAGVASTLKPPILFNELLLRLDSVHGISNNREDALMKLQSCHKLPNESMSIFAERVRQLIFRAYPNFNEDFRDEHSLRIFVQGLPTKYDIRLQMRLKQFTSLQDAVDYAIKLEQIITDEKQVHFSPNYHKAYEYNKVQPQVRFADVQFPFQESDELDNDDEIESTCLQNIVTRVVKEYHDNFIKDRKEKRTI